MSPASQADSLPLSHQGSPWHALYHFKGSLNEAWVVLWASDLTGLRHSQRIYSSNRWCWRTWTGDHTLRILCLQTRVSQSGHSWHLGPENSLLSVRGCPVPCRMFTCFSGVCPRGASDTSKILTTKDFSRYFQMTHGGSRWQNSPQVESHWSRPFLKGDGPMSRPVLGDNRLDLWLRQPLSASPLTPSDPGRGIYEGAWDALGQHLWTLIYSWWNETLVLAPSGETSGHFPAGPVVESRPCNTGDVGSIPGQGARILHAPERLAAKPKCLN